jgi:adenylate cyclase
MPSHQPNFRFDFKYTPIKYDKKTSLLTLAAEPDPERYEIKEENGEKWYYDKFDHVCYSEKMIIKFHLSFKGLPLYYSPSKIDDADKYINDRITATLKFFENNNKNFEFVSEDDSEDFLEDLDNVEMNFVILSIDLKDSTKMSQDLPKQLNVKIISLFYQEMILLINNFNGYVLKPTGDGLIAYFPEPNTIGKVDNALNCADLMREIIIHVINPLLVENSAPNLYFRIGIDFGKDTVKIMGVKGIKSSTELIGETINIAVKMQNLAKENEIIVGASAVHKAHTYWRKRLRRFKLPKEWKYIDKLTGKRYPLYYLKD